MSPAGSIFSHRCNGNGDYESICPGCFLTIGHAPTPQELTLLEEFHACKGMDALKVSISARETMLRQVRFGLFSG